MKHSEKRSPVPPIRHATEAGDAAMPLTLRRLTEQYGRLSASHRRLAAAVLGKPLEAAFWSSAELAANAGVSESTVTRFTVALGYSGYPAFVRELQAIARSRLRTGERLSRSRQAGVDEYGRALQEDVQNLELLATQVSSDALEQAATLITGARTVALVAARSSAAIGVYLETYLNMLGKPVRMFRGDPGTIDLLGRMGPEDVAIGVGFSRYTSFTVKAVRYLYGRGVPVLAITDHLASPLALSANLVLLTPTQAASPVDSLVAPLAMAQALIRLLMNRLPADSVGELLAMEELWASFGVYERMWGEDTEERGE
ncbi:MAG: MurR/RpiR family transcriptional regulator [Thermaerobacter sp.]|nr:MurR/RpiR family transcriptional regulator [Thermaerobacter sp.]